MTETLYALVADWGLWIVAASAFLSCLAFPIPTFAVMLAGGAFAATGDLTLWSVLVTAYLAAIAGDNTGYHIGRLGGAPLLARLRAAPARAVMVDRAEETVRTWGPLGVFFSTWLVAPLGPYVNFISGAAGMRWGTFLAWDAAGEAIWVTGYVLLGYIFAEKLDVLTGLVGDWGGLVSSVSIAVIAGFFLIRAMLNEGDET
ncbi:DedA family protein [Silicimonas algicola]|uniref:Membrane protein DedA with SNARE-associated domain n=1 Tax=Silicimonas algicola TaxID=1826607 RepID=A0A316GUR5_9RHOB|nr:DedA family protein [Silicimonas algicola]AZQ66469.1 DedA family protein [Silicimonas algicola]PWK58807.1 membrane protein DedA with SNARE-associated domain [Silicimonas algicola]